jgi:SAM-dependent methyltransferase
MTTDSDWAQWGEVDPYYAVLAWDRFRKDRLTPEDVAEFFETGEEDVRRVMATIRRHIRPEFAPASALDFGCGTGRVALALARICPVTGVDIAPGMLREAAHNARERGITAARFTAELSGGPFDLVHSYMVFQHIPVKRGLVLADALLDMVAPAGVGVLHFVYRVRASFLRRTASTVIGVVPGMRGLLAAARGRPRSDPHVQMNAYPLDRIFALFQRKGLQAMIQYTDHGGNLGVMCYVWRD